MQYSEIKTFRTLVEERGLKSNGSTLFVTISPNPRTMVPCQLTRYKWHGLEKKPKIYDVKRPYGMLKQDVQYQYCIKCLMEDYMEWLGDDAQLVGVAELNESGNVHLHMLINSANVKNDVQLAIFRRDVLNGYRTQQNLKNMKARDFMNNIVFLNKHWKDIEDYLMKDQDKMLPRFKNYYL